MTIEIKNRKNTTEKGLDAIETLLEKINEDLRQDIEIICSCEFDSKYTASNGFYTNDIHYCEWENRKGVIRIKDGRISILSCNSTQVSEYTYCAVNAKSIQSLDFSGFWAALQELIEKYNVACKEKDAEVSEFLSKIEALAN